MESQESRLINAMDPDRRSRVMSTLNFLRYKMRIHGKVVDKDSYDPNLNSPIKGLEEEVKNLLIQGHNSLNLILAVMIYIGETRAEKSGRDLLGWAREIVH